MSESKPSAGHAVEAHGSNLRLLRAAVSGLLALGAGACGSDADESSAPHQHDEELSENELDALCTVKVDKALAEQDLDKLCADVASDDKASREPEEADLPKLCGDLVTTARGEVDAKLSDMQDMVKTLKEQLAARDDELTKLKEKARPLLQSSEEKTIESEQKEYTFAALTKMCDERGGYTQIHAACGGHNACAGFSYGDWGPGAATLTEHSCTGVNGCLGLSCVVLPKDGGKTGKELYEADDPFPEPLNGCGGCHGGYNDASGKWTHDKAYFAVYIQKDSTRTAENWLDRSAAEQEKITAFGAHGTLTDGTAYQNMAAYHGVMSRAEVERIVAYIRTLKPYIYTIKTADPAPTKQ